MSTDEPAQMPVNPRTVLNDDIAFNWNDVAERYKSVRSLDLVL